MRYYRQHVMTQDEINAAAQEIADELTGLPLIVQPNGYGYRIECTAKGCGWSRCHGPVQEAREHGATHVSK
jgi:hypothetical protein